MSIRTAAEKIAEPVAARPETFRLPKPGVSDPYFGFSRSFYYSGEERGYWKLVRIRDEGRSRGVTLIPFADVLKFVRAEAAKADASNAEIDADGGHAATLEQERPEGGLEP